MKDKLKEKKKSIAVLPFVNMSTDPENEYFSDGVTEEIINVLAKIKSLRVISRTSAFHFKGKNIDIQDIGSQLKVSMLLEGSVRKSGNKTRITTQLINAEDGFHLWSETYNHQLVDIFQAQDEIAMAVAEKMREHLGHFEIKEPKERKNSNINAYKLYLKSKFNFNVFHKADILLAVEQIEEVIKMDDSCPFYHASKALYYGYMGLLNIIPNQEAFTISKKAAEIAISLDPNDPEANYAYGVVYYFFEKDLDKAQFYVDLALKNRPNYTEALLGGSVIEGLAGSYKIAIGRIKKARKIDPLTPTNIYYHAALLLRAGKYEQSLVKINALLELVPHHTNSYCMKGMILTRLKKYEEAVEHYKKVPSTPDKNEIYYSGIGIAYATQGNHKEAKKYLAKVKLDEQNFNVAAEENAKVIINIYLGNLDLAFERVEQDIKANKYYLNFYTENPAFNLLKDDPRYEIFDQVFKTKGVNHQNEKPSQSKYQRSGLSEERINLINDKLMELMVNEKPFVDSSISLKSLSEGLDESANYISQVINDRHEVNFNDFINSYRIDEMKRLIEIPANSNFTLVALSYDAGFNSKSTFNAAFQKLKGQSPKAYFKNLGIL
jgi:adenylate cyclase